MKPAYLTISNDMNPDNKESLEAYASQVAPMASANGGEMVLRVSTSEVIKGAPPQILTVLRFPNAQLIREMLSSDEYKKLIPLRDKAFSNLSISITEDVAPAGPGAKE